MNVQISKARVRSAIVGTGAIAVAHARAIQACETRSQLVAAVDVDLDRAKVFADAWEVPHAYQSLADLLQAQEVDLVHLCTPPGQHAELALACLAAGVTVLVEKPPTLSLAELSELCEAERRSPGFVATVFQHRFGAGAVRLRRLAESGALGRPLVATCTTAWFRDDAYYEPAWRGTWQGEGGGPTMGHGIHQFDLLFSVLGEWQEVTAVAARQARATDTEDVSMALVTFANGAVASVVNSVLSPRETSALRFDYEHATVEVEHLYGYTDDDWRITPAPGHDGLRSTWDADHTDVSSSHQGQLVAVLDALEREEAPPVTLADAEGTMEFIAALYASAFTGKRIKRGEIGPNSPFSRRMDGSGAPWQKEDRR